MCLSVVEQPCGAHEARRCKRNNSDAAEHEREAFITSERPGQPFVRSLWGAADCAARDRRQEEVELLDHEAKRDHGNAGSHPGKECSLVRSVIAVAADHEGTS